MTSTMLDDITTITDIFGKITDYVVTGFTNGEKYGLIDWNNYFATEFKADLPTLEKQCGLLNPIWLNDNSTSLQTNYEFYRIVSWNYLFNKEKTMEEMKRLISVVYFVIIFIICREIRNSLLQQWLVSYTT
jgi:hypothetical protein